MPAIPLRELLAPEESALLCGIDALGHQSLDRCVEEAHQREDNRRREEGGSVIDPRVSQKATVPRGVNNTKTRSPNVRTAGRIKMPWTMKLRIPTVDNAMPTIFPDHESVRGCRAQTHC